MRNLVVLAGLIAIMTMGCSNNKKSSTADSVTIDTTAEKPVDSATMMKAWDDYMKPGESHAILAKWIGKWKVEQTFYTMGNQEVKATSTAEYKMIFGGRYLKCNYSGKMDKMVFEGENTTAFDNSRKMFLSTWIDNMGTGLMYMEGTYDASTKTINSKGKTVDPSTGKVFEIRETHQMIDENTQEMEMFDIKDGKETKSMTLKLTRIK